MVLVASFSPGLDRQSLPPSPEEQTLPVCCVCYPAILRLSEVTHLRGKAELFPTGCRSRHTDTCFHPSEAKALVPGENGQQ